jgi:hypothetical protein
MYYKGAAETSLHLFFVMKLICNVVATLATED